jgi:hypothetical protein
MDGTLGLFRKTGLMTCSCIRFQLEVAELKAKELAQHSTNHQSGAARRGRSNSIARKRLPK